MLGNPGKAKSPQIEYHPTELNTHTPEIAIFFEFRVLLELKPSVITI